MVLLTGATGFIGSHVADRLLRDGLFQVVTIVRKSNNNEKIEELSEKGAVIVEGCFYDESLLEKVFTDYSITHVIHLAAIRSEGTHSKEDYYEVNVGGTEGLLVASHRHGVQRFIYCSSVGVFGIPPQELPASAETKLNGDTEYQKSKILAEKTVCDFIVKGLDAYIVRPTITYGKGDSGFPPTLVRLVKRGLLPLSTHRNLIHLVDIDTLAKVFVAMVMENNLKQRVYVVADRSPVPLRELADLVHAYYYGRPYKGLLNLPDVLCRALLLFFQMIGNQKWLTRGRLLFCNWYYENDGFHVLGMKEFPYTNERFVKYLEQAA